MDQPGINPNGIHKTGRTNFVLIGLLLLVHGVLAIDCARRLSVTYDEYWHLPVGLLSLKTGRFDFDTLNPPLIRAWAALPLLCGGAKSGPVDRLGDATSYGDAFLAANPDRYFQWFAWGRGMIVLLSVGCGLILAAWSYELFGPKAALLTTLLWASSPTFLAHGSLVTTDLGAAFLFLATIYALWKFGSRPAWRPSLVFGLCLGLAQLAKFTCLELYPLSIALWFVLRYRNPAVAKSAPRIVWLQWFAALVLSGVVLNSGYLWQGSFSSLGSYKLQSRGFGSLNELPGWIPVPVPRDYLTGLDRQKQIMESAHPVYLDHEWSTSGFRHYYLMALWYKVPHVSQCLALLAAWFLVRPGMESRKGREQVFLLLPVALLLGIASSTGMQLGLRYVLPALPFLTLFTGQTARWFDAAKYHARTRLLLVLIALLPFSLRYHPHHLAYFNEWAGGPLNGRWHLVDSNLDWGQDLRSLKEYLDRQPVPELRLAYFGSYPPAALGIKYQLPRAGFPEPGWYAVSVNFVQGSPHTLRTPDGKAVSFGLDAFGYLRFFEPVARIGYSIDVYHLTSSDVIRWQSARQAM